MFRTDMHARNALSLSRGGALWPQPAMRACEAGMTSFSAQLPYMARQYAHLAMHICVPDLGKD